MEKINRRSFLRNTAAAGAAGATVAVPVVVAAEEMPVTRVNRLAHELSRAMDDWCSDMDYGNGPNVWKAHVYPSRHLQYPVMFEHIDHQASGARGLHELDALLADFLAKKEAWEATAPGDMDLETDCAEYEAAEAAADLLICFQCSTLEEITKKVGMVLDHWWLSENLWGRQDEFLKSLIPGRDVLS